jgi:uncharacterized membrane protein
VSTPQELADEIIAAEKMDHQTVNPNYEQYDHDPVIDQYIGCYEAAIDDYGFF